QPEAEREELAQIYVGRGLDPDLARQVADQLMAHDALGAHARDELGITEVSTARPVQAALTSALTFGAGAALPLIVTALVPLGWVIPGVSLATLLSLALLGALGAQAGGVGRVRPTLRVVFWGALAMPATALVGSLCGGEAENERVTGWRTSSGAPFSSPPMERTIQPKPAITAAASARKNHLAQSVRVRA